MVDDIASRRGGVSGREVPSLGSSDGRGSVGKRSSQSEISDLFETAPSPSEPSMHSTPNRSLPREVEARAVVLMEKKVTDLSTGLTDDMAHFLAHLQSAAPADEKAAEDLASFHHSIAQQKLFVRSRFSDWKNSEPAERGDRMADLMDALENRTAACEAVLQHLSVDDGAAGDAPIDSDEAEIAFMSGIKDLSEANQRNVNRYAHLYHEFPGRETFRQIMSYGLAENDRRQRAAEASGDTAAFKGLLKDRADFMGMMLDSLRLAVASGNQAKADNEHRYQMLKKKFVDQGESEAVISELYERLQMESVRGVTTAELADPQLQNLQDAISLDTMEKFLLRVRTPESRGKPLSGSELNMIHEGIGKGMRAMYREIRGV